MNRFFSLLFLLICSAATTAIAQKPAPLPDYMLVGTYTNTDAHSEGIYVYAFDSGTGGLTLRSKIGGITNPSFLAVSPDRKFVYAVGESDGGGLVYAYAFDRKAGQLTLINQQPAGGGGSCHLTLDKTGRWLLVGNYGGGNLSVLPVAANGSLSPAQQTIQHTGNGPDKQRQEAPHVHQVVVASNNRDVLVPDLGLDRTMLYQLDAQTGRLSAASPASVSGTAGGGPRHLALHPKGTAVYVLEELSGNVIAYAHRDEQLKPMQTISALPPGYTGPAAAAEILTSPDGKFLYASVRGNNTVTMFTINPDTDRLTYRSNTPVGGKGPRSFTLDPSGRWLLVANQYTNTVTRFARDPNLGTLTASGEPVPVPAPVCLLPVPGR